MKKGSKKDLSNPNQSKIENFFALTKDHANSKDNTNNSGSSGKSNNQNTIISNNNKSENKNNATFRQVTGYNVNTYNMEKIDNSKRNNNNYNGYESTKTIELEDLDEKFGKKRGPLIENFLENSKTYCLPCHIPKIWRVAKPLLEDIKNKKIKDLVSFLEIIMDIMRSHYVIQLDNLNIENLRLLIESLNKNEIIFFFEELLPFLANLALQVENWFKSTPLLILNQNNNNFVNLEKKQVACLLAHMFFCTLNIQNNSMLPDEFSFYLLYKNERKNDIKMQKLRCIYHYFKRIHKNLPDTYITYQRLGLSMKIHGKLDAKYWLNSQSKLKPVIFKDDGGIEKTKKAIHVDFANCSLGGGVLNAGCVQEEIRFTICPELLPAILFTERLLDHEAVIVFGTEQYCDYEGYDDKFRFIGDYKDESLTDSFLRKDTCVLAIDALNFSKNTSPNVQFKHEKILRELNKAYIGFYGSDQESGERRAIATGKWGCGIFKGNAQFKFILQWLAASQANRSMIFFRFNDKSLIKCERIIKKLYEKSVGEVFQLLNNYHDLIFQQNIEMEFFDFLFDVD